MRTPAIALVAAVSLFAFCTRASGQEYATPAPRTTDLRRLHALAIARAVHAYFTRGIADEQRGAWDDAARSFEAVLALHPPEPQNSTARYDLAIAYAGLRRYDDAASQLRAALRADPGFLAAWANLAAIDLRRGDLAEARDAARRLLALAPSSARGLYERGLIALQDGDLRAARTAFSTLAGSNPRYALAHYDLAVVLARSGDLAQAEREFRLALALAPRYARASLGLGVVLVREGRLADARAAFAAAAAESADDPVLHVLALSLERELEPPPAP